MSSLTDYADLVVVAINATDFLDGVDAVRSYADWDETLEDMGTLHCDVVPVNYDNTNLASRGQLNHELMVDIGIRYRFGQSDQVSGTGRVDNAAVDAKVDTLEQIAEHFVTDRLGTDDLVWERVDIRVAYSREMLRENRQYTGIVRLTYQTTKDVP